VVGGTSPVGRPGRERPGRPPRAHWRDGRRPGWARRLEHYAPVLAGGAVVALVVSLAPSSLPGLSPNAPRGGQAQATAPPLPDPPGSAGVAVSGVRCGPGARQVPWSRYAPWCQPAFHGSNGGATSPGVTGTTIRVSYREVITGPVAAAIGQIGESLVGTNAQTISTMQAYIRVFNRSFELYGRHVVLEPFPAKGNFVTEEAGGGQAQAQQDADTARSLGAFADVSAIGATIPYSEALARDHVIGIGAPYVSAEFLRQNAPFAFTPGPNCDKLTSISTAIIGRGFGRMPAIFAGDGRLRSRPRVIGLVTPDNPVYNACDGGVPQYLARRYHLHLARVIRYPFSLTGDSQDAANMVAQLKAAGVTTVFCGCDPETPIYMTKAANALGYHPEWVSINVGDAYSRLPDQNQWSHDVAGGQVERPAADQEAYHVYRMVVPTGPIVPSYASVYEPLLLLFDALQAAGPDLTPANFERGFWSLPPSLPGGMYGQWSFGPGSYDASSSFQVEWWDPNAVSPADGRKGVYQACNGGAQYSDFGPPELPSGRQLQCFGP
jgi:hypothetical protein